MKYLLLLLPLFLSSPAIVADIGYCPDVSSPSCPVRDYWPRNVPSVGEEGYWLKSVNRQVCFVTQFQYAQAIIGREYDCLWRNWHS